MEHNNNTNDDALNLLSGLLEKDIVENNKRVAAGGLGKIVEPVGLNKDVYSTNPIENEVARKAIFDFGLGYMNRAYVLSVVLTTKTINQEMVEQDIKNQTEYLNARCFLPGVAGDLADAPAARNIEEIARARQLAKEFEATPKVSPDVGLFGGLVPTINGISEKLFGTRIEKLHKKIISSCKEQEEAFEQKYSNKKAF